MVNKNILLLILLLTETDGVTMVIFNITVGMDCPKKRITDHIEKNPEFGRLDFSSCFFFNVLK